MIAGNEQRFRMISRIHEDRRSPIAEPDQLDRAIRGERETRREKTTTMDRRKRG